MKNNYTWFGYMDGYHRALRDLRSSLSDGLSPIDALRRCQTHWDCKILPWKDLRQNVAPPDLLALTLFEL